MPAEPKVVGSSPTGPATLKLQHVLEFRNHDLDLAIVADVPEGVYRRQDVDDLAKTVFDALQEGSDSEPYLFKKDSQIVRLLVYKQVEEKLEGKEFKDYGFCQLHARCLSAQYYVALGVS